MPPAPTAPALLHVLHPGDVAFGVRGDRFQTLLGSCVAVVLTDPRRTVGAMCHIVHAGAPTSTVAARSTAHAGPALDALFALLRGHAINPLLCQAWVFGGGNMFPARFGSGHVGDANTAWALQTLAALGIAVIGHDVGGAAYRRVGWTVGPAAPAVDAVAV